jgi:hypothetical protein
VIVCYDQDGPIFRLHGFSKAIVSDRDPKFTSKFWKNQFKSLKRQLRFSTSLNPDTDAQTERLRGHSQLCWETTWPNPHSTWTTDLPLGEFAYNSSRQTRLPSLWSMWEILLIPWMLWLLRFLTNLLPHLRHCSLQCKIAGQIPETPCPMPRPNMPNSQMLRELPESYHLLIWCFWKEILWRSIQSLNCFGRDSTKF